MNLLKGKTIIVTGGSHGIGMCIVKKCVKEGARLVIIARNKNDLEKSLSTIKNISDEEHQQNSLDVSDYNSVILFKDWLIKKKINVSGLVNCAGIYGPIGSTVNLDMKNFSQTININFLGTVYMCSTLAPLMISDGIKKIINYSGGGAATPFANYSAYACSKAAIVRFTENLSLELDINEYNINCVAPGFVATRLHRDTISAGALSAGNDFYQKTINQINGDAISPDVAANLTIFLLSTNSDGINGKFISAPWDDWQKKYFQEKLLKDKETSLGRPVEPEVKCND